MTQNNEQAFIEAKRFIDGKNRLLLATHTKTDGDDCGSMLAMTFALESMGKKITAVAEGGVPPSLQFLPGQTKVLNDVPGPVNAESYDGIILFGCGKKSRAGLNKIVDSDLPMLNIDHHPDNQRFGQVNLVDPSKSSVAELIYDFLKWLGLEFNSDIAKCLLTGMFTDTGSFMHSNTQASTLIAAGELMKYGARIDKIYDETFQNKDLPTLKAWARAVENTRLIQNNKVAISVITQKDLDDLGTLPVGAFDGFVETLNKIPGIRFAMFLHQEGERVKGSMRSEESKEMDVSFLARILGGGGHKLAAGFEIPGKIIKDDQGSWRIEKSTQ